MASQPDNGEITLLDHQITAKRVVFALVPILVVAVLVWGYLLYDLLLSPSSISRTMGPQENHYWTVARFQISELLAEKQILMYEQGLAPDFDAVSSRIDVVKSRYFLIANRSDAADMLAGLPAFKPTISRLDQDLRQVSSLLPALENNPRTGSQLLPLFDDIRQVSDVLARQIGNAEVADRDRIYNDFVHKRRNLFIASAGVGVAASILFVFVILYEQRRRAFSALQSATIEAEQRANRVAADALLAKNAFLGAVGHELRTPLQRITTAIEILAGTEGHSLNAKILGQLDRASRQLEAQMRDLTDYARLDSGKLSLKIEAFNPANDVRDAAEDLRSFAAGKQIELDVKVASTSGLYAGDATRVRQIVTNLVSNAIKYTQDGGRVLVEARVEPDDVGAHLHLTIADTGMGIPADRIDDVFKPFTQVPATLPANRRKEGIGMGLAIVRGLVDLMGGSIAVDSRVRTGTIFSVRLPLEQVPGSAEYMVEPRAEPISRRVLIVDDQEFAREALADICAALNLSCVAVGSANEALARLKVEPFDVVIIDIEMPGTNGLELAGALRAGAGPNQHTSIVWVSATPPESHTAPVSAPFDHYLMKPVRVNELERTLNAVLHGYQGGSAA